MASSSSSSSTSNSLPSPPPPPPRSHLFTPIPELEVEKEEGEKASAAAEDTFPYKHQPTPLHLQPKKAGATTPTNGSFSVLCNKCRPSSRDKNSVVPVVDSSSLKSPSSKFHSLLSSLTRGRSPKPAPTPSSAISSAPEAASDDATYWKMATVELSRKLIGATRKRDEALLEASRLKHSVSDLERKLTKLESYCLYIRTSLDSQLMSPTIPFPTDLFLSGVTSARAAVRALARSSRGGSPLAHVEASLNRVFYDDFERCSNEGGSSSVLDPAGRCQASRAAYEAVRGITWEEVLTKGTKHYSEGLSRFCDKKMSEVVTTLGWSRAWPEILLQAFFVAAKGVWMVRLLARCAHPAVPVMRVEGGAAFDSMYMEDVVVGEKVRRLTPVSVKMMVSPGFYVYSASAGGVGVVKCKVLCAYSNTVESGN